MKKIAVLCLVLVCLLVLAGCGCKHETWNEADCLNPKTCAECGETEGEALGHSWVDADCLNPKTCSACGETEGEAPGHTWTDADCVNPKTCSACGETEGEALGHSWVDATTEAPKTCETCGETEGERIITDARFTTGACQSLFGSWKGEVVFAGDMLSTLGLEGIEGEIPIAVTYTFGNDGSVTTLSEFVDWEGFLEIMRDYMLDMMAAEFAAQGISQADVEAFYGMTLEEIVDVSLNAMKPEDMAASTEMVYYVDGGTLYTAMSWDEEMVGESFTLEGDTLTVQTVALGEMVLTRVAE